MVTGFHWPNTGRLPHSRLRNLKDMQAAESGTEQVREIQYGTTSSRHTFPNDVQRRPRLISTVRSAEPFSRTKSFDFSSGSIKTSTNFQMHPQSRRAPTYNCLLPQTFSPGTPFHVRFDLLCVPVLTTSKWVVCLALPWGPPIIQWHKSPNDVKRRIRDHLKMVVFLLVSLKQKRGTPKKKQIWHCFLGFSLYKLANGYLFSQRIPSNIK